jgi:hypothetical protein
MKTKQRKGDKEMNCEQRGFQRQVAPCQGSPSEGHPRTKDFCAAKHRACGRVTGTASRRDTFRAQRRNMVFNSSLASPTEDFSGRPFVVVVVVVAAVCLGSPRPPANLRGADHIRDDDESGSSVVRRKSAMLPTRSISSGDGIGTF